MDSRTQKMAQVIIRYSTAVKPGDLVLIRGISPAAQPLMQALYEEALRAGGNAFTYLHMSDEKSIGLEAGAEAQIQAINPMLKLMYDTADVIIRVESEENTRESAGYAIEKNQAWMRSYGALINIQSEREGKKTLRRCTTLYPSQAYAQDAGMSLRAYEDFVFSAGMLHLDDPVAHWKNVEVEQEKLCKYLDGHKKLHVRGSNIDMEMSIEGRKFVSANGTANFPDGEIFTSPVEDSVNGWVRFTFPAIYHGNAVYGVELRFENGLVTKATAERNESYLLAMLNTDAAARRLGEFAIGTNNGIDRFTGHILFDEKIGGTVHMALGTSYPEAGGVNLSAIHWDMICDMRDGGEILIDGARFYENGKFLLS
jgi:aminopeptidase